MGTLGTLLPPRDGWRISSAASAAIFRKASMWPSRSRAIARSTSRSRTSDWLVCLNSPSRATGVWPMWRRTASGRRELRSKRALAVRRIITTCLPRGLAPQAHLANRATPRGLTGEPKGDRLRESTVTDAHSVITAICNFSNDEMCSARHDHCERLVHHFAHVSQPELAGTSCVRDARRFVIQSGGVVNGPQRP